jgi:hypothetical protein
VNLVRNIGFGEGATHLDDSDHPFADVLAQPIEFPLRHPPRIEVQADVDRAMWRALVGHSERARRRDLRRRLIDAYRGGGLRRLRERRP